MSAQYKKKPGAAKAAPGSKNYLKLLDTIEASAAANRIGR
jgi:hypothetical protein